ncbi:MAG: PAS domain-containing protein, partial [Anaerolineae bacterium]|nr:PAS domain-containing protein [Anaerolineae bacterium]
ALTDFVTQWELAEDNQVFEKEYRLRNAAGEYRWLRSYESILRRDSGGVPTQIVGMAADITEQKRAEEALRESRLFIEKIMNTIPVRIFWKDTHHVYQGCNAAFARDAGFANPQDLVGKDDYQLWPGLAEMYRDNDRQVIESGVARLLIEEPLITVEGNSRLVQTSKVPLRNSSDEIVGVLGMYLDITERKVAEEALRKSEELMRYIVKYDPNSIAVFDRNMHYLAVSDRYLRDYGVKEEDILGKHHYQVFPEMPQKWKDVHERCLAGAIERNDDDYFERLDGSITYNRWECRPWHQVDGSIGGIVLYSEVTTERKLMEEALRENRAILQAAMDNSPAGIAIADAPDGKLRYVNDAGLMIRGGDRQQIVEGIGIDQYVASWQLMDLDGRPLKPDEVPLARAILFGETNSREFIVRRESDDDRIVLANAAPILDEDAKVKAAIVVFSDITENKQAEAKIRKLNTELEARVADRTAQLITANQELEAFSYSVSHDLRAPLRSIEGFSAILLEEYAESLDEVGKHYLARIKEGSERMGQLINDMLHLSQVTTLSEFHREHVNLSELAAQIAAEFSAESPQRKVEFDIAADLIVSGDENLLKIVLENLLNNALKFTVRRETAIIQVGMIEHDGKPTYFVRDNGAGFDMAYASRLFAPFQRLHSSQEFPGTGIGLATVQRIIHRHGGRVWAEGAVDNGATFYFTVA